MIMKLAFAILIAIFTACSGSVPVTTRSFSYYEGHRPRKMKLRVPKGYIDEMQKVSPGSKEQFYTYRSGSRLYIGLNMSWPSPNQERKLIHANEQGVISGSFSGSDSNGLYWKEIHFEGFIFGYSYVPAAQKEEFDLALHSLRVK
jgi:hypothetical protein